MSPTLSPPRPQVVIAILALLLGAACSNPATDPGAPADALTEGPAEARGPQNPALVNGGREIFRFDTYGNETFWSDTLGLHEAIAAAVSPQLALQVGLKVDADALPAEIKAALAAQTIDLEDPATTVALLDLDAVVGVSGQVEGGKLIRVGITCALCHSTVDNSLAPGIGRRLDGWPNRDLDVGAIVALSDSLTPAQRAVYESWAPGMYDPRFNIDGKNIPVVLPPAFGLRHVQRELYTGDDVVSYWNAYVAITQMHGHGTFVDARIGVNVSNPPDLVSSKLAALRAYQLSLETPQPRSGDFDPAAAKRGKFLFNTTAGCARCHLGTIYSDVNTGKLHAGEDVGQDPAYALRSVTKKYRTTPLRGLWNPPQLDGPYFHDGSATTLADVVDHYVALFGLSLTAQQKSDLVEYLKTL